MDKNLTVADLAESLQRRGMTRLYLRQPLPDPSQSSLSIPPRPAEKSVQAKPESQPYVRNYRIPDPQTVMTKQNLLKTLETPLHQCTRCPLNESRTHLVFGFGNPDADLMFIGEGPGRDEDQQGIPFVGRAGQLLTDMIVKGMQIKREDVYIANMVKCRPPENRNPEAEEMEACFPFLDEQITIIAPRVIVTLGAVPAGGLLKDKTGITRLRGNWRSYKGIPVMPTLHPAYLLRNPPAKKDCWEDLKQVIAFLNGELIPSIPAL